MSVRKVSSPPPAPLTRTEAPTGATRPVAPPAASRPPAAANTFEARGADAARALGQVAPRPSEHVAGSVLPGERTGRSATPGPLSLGSRTAQEAIQKSLAFLDGKRQGASREAVGGASAQASQGFRPRSVEVDELGMTHVRLDRVHEGVKVLGEQVVSHLDAQGNVARVNGDDNAIPAGLGSEKLKLSSADAREVALQAFVQGEGAAVGGKTDRTPTVERVLYRDADGHYRNGYRVELTNLFGSAEPMRMNYLVDAQSGQVAEKWNQIGGFHLPEHGAAATTRVTGSATPNLPIPDRGQVQSKLVIDQDVSIEKLGVGLDIPHTYKGDLVVTLTSPSGTSHVIHNRTGGGTDDVKGDFDLSAFKGESSKGEWTLTVEDKAGRDVGTLKAWGLDIHGTAKEQPVPESIEKSTSPKAPITDRQTTTSTIDITEGGSVDSLALDLDISHTYRGDLVVTLTSPSGKSAVVSNREGASKDDIRGSFDLSAFKDEPVTGRWTLSVEDRAAGDKGTLNSWGLRVKTKKGEQPPPPPPPPEPTGANDTSLYSGTVDLSTTRNSDGSYRLEDTTRGQGVVTLDAQNKTRPQGPVQLKDANDAWGEAGDDARTKSAVDAHYGASMTYDMFRDVLGRNSIDGQGEKLQSNVHIDRNYVNAFWDGTTMNYGDGDGRNSGPLTTLDIAGHEISHGLTERTAGLIYRNESGGINESMSDILGTGVEWYASQRNNSVRFDWAVGEDAWTPTNGDDTDALRYMDDPTKDDYSVDHYSNYPKQTEVHGSSGIMNNAFYLLVNGGTNRTSKMTVEQGIGMEKGLKIFGRALMHYMTPNTTFSQARAHTLSAATDLYGADSAEVQTLKQAWDAVGVK